MRINNKTRWIFAQLIIWYKWDKCKFYTLIFHPAIFFTRTCLVVFALSFN